MENRNKICPRCGYVADPDFVFCAKCGTPLVQPVVNQPQNPNPQAVPFEPVVTEAQAQQKVIDEKEVYRYNYDGKNCTLSTIHVGNTCDCNAEQCTCCDSYEKK